MKILIVGAVAGGATALARLRRLDEDAEIIVFERGEYVSYANCGLPYYIGGTIRNRDALFVSNKEDIEQKYNVEIRLKSLVTKIDRENKRIEVKNLLTGEEYFETYDKLLLSTGSSPFIPNSSWLEDDGVFKLWTIPDTDRIHDYISSEKPKSAVIVGGGFIGLEMVENLVEKGIKVYLCDMADQVMPPMDKDMAKLVENHLIEKGVKLYLGNGLKDITNNGKKVILSDGVEIETDMIILSIGVRPNTKLAEEAGLVLNERKGIKVNEYMQTSDENIYAVGDAIGVKNFVFGTETMIPLAGPANKQGRNVAENIVGNNEKKYVATMGTSIAKVFDIAAASVGESEKSLQRVGKEYEKDYFITIIHPMSHAGYYPDATPMTLKLIFGRDGKVLGAQIVGYDGVDKRIDTIATTMHFGGTVKDLTELELAYAPPFSSAKDPVNFAGYTAENILAGLFEPITYHQMMKEKDRYQLLDIREDLEVATGKLENSICIPLTRLRDEYEKLDKDKEYIVYCAVGVRGYIAQRILAQKGYKAKNLVGGLRTYYDMEEKKEGASFVPIDTSQDKFPIGGSNVINLDLCGLSCPGPIVQVSKKLETLNDGEIIEAVATDPGFAKDIKSWCENTGNTLLETNSSKGKFYAKIKKSSATETSVIAPTNSVKEKTMIVFDGDLDKAIASFIIATGAAAMGNKVHMFFTFWGLSVIRKENAVEKDKDFISKMFSAMLPKGSKKLGLSKMNFFGAGSKMMRSVMEKKGVTSLEELIVQAQEAGVEMTACQMSMDVMGLTVDELIDGVKVGGVATMLNNSDNSNMNLFI